MVSLRRGTQMDAERHFPSGHAIAIAVHATNPAHLAMRPRMGR